MLYYRLNPEECLGQAFEPGWSILPLLCPNFENPSGAWNQGCISHWSPGIRKVYMRSGVFLYFFPRYKGSGAWVVSKVSQVRHWSRAIRGHSWPGWPLNPQDWWQQSRGSMEGSLQVFTPGPLHWFKAHSLKPMQRMKRWVLPRLDLVLELEGVSQLPDHAAGGKPEGALLTSSLFVSGGRAFVLRGVALHQRSLNSSISLPADIWCIGEPSSLTFGRSK